MSESEIIEAAMAKWNAEADQSNQWFELGCDEKLELVVRAALALTANQSVVAWMTEDAERVITDATKQKMPLAVQAPYTTALCRVNP
jgi:hypothetical protein